MNWIQRDLEDQIKEEKNQNLKKQIMEQQVKKSIKVSDVVTLLKSGVSRYKKDDVGNGSIQEKYNLSWSECKEIFNHPKIKGIKRKNPTVSIIDDTENTTEVAIVNQEVIQEQEVTVNDLFN